MKLNIGIDIDGTITDAYQWIGLLNNYFGLTLTKEDMTSYHVEDFTDITTKDFSKFVIDCGGEMCSTAIPRPGAGLYMNKLHKDHNICYVTARGEGLRDVTKAWLSQYSFPLTDLHMLHSHNKLQKAQELKCDLFIEDRYETAVELATAGIRVLLLDTNYNRKPLIPGVTRVYNWEEIEEEIESLSKEEKATSGYKRGLTDANI